MTNEQLEKAERIQAEIHGCKKDLDKVYNFQDRIPEICTRGLVICTGTNYDIVLVPRKGEITDMLVTMRSRIENRISELEKEFEEL